MNASPRFDPLTRAAIRAGSDKYGGHLYTPIYHRLFAPLREMPLKVLEIGVGGYEAEQAGGLGLKMWAEYFPNATITGLDIQAKKLSLPPRVKVVQGSQTDRALLARLSQERGPFDIVIDDGSHVVTHVQETFRALYPLIAADGIYAVEDTQTSFMPSVGGRPDGLGTIFDLAHRIALAMHKAEGFRPSTPDPAIEAFAAATASVSIYRNIAVFQRGTNTYPSNHGLDLNNPEVRAVFDGIGVYDALDPSPGSVLTRVDMLIWAGRHAEAGDLATRAAAAYPAHTAMLHELVRMMGWAKLDQQRHSIESRLPAAA
jgi:hypothetical protein